MNTTALKKGDECSHDHEFENFEVQTLDFVTMEIYDLDPIKEGEELLMTVRLDRYTRPLELKLRGNEVAVFKYEDGTPEYKIRGPANLQASENGFEVENCGPCHICGSRVGTVHCYVCGHAVCNRMPEDADPDGFLPEHEFPCKSGTNTCKNCKEEDENHEGYE